MFRVPWYLRNGHIQSILTSVGPRRWLTARAARGLSARSRPVLLDGGGGVRLMGLLATATTPREPRGFVSLIHGWEGSARSCYVLSAAVRLWSAGFDVLRLNLRDHGDTHHLNRDPFHAERLDEVLWALRAAHELGRGRDRYLVGFSLGGNIALRAASHPAARDLGLKGVVGICPVVKPAEATRELGRGPFVYRYYFIKKWRRSLEKKSRLFPELELDDALARRANLWELHDLVIPLLTRFPDAESYFSSYELTGSTLEGLSAPTRVIASRDDPVLSPRYLDEIPRNPQLSIELVPHGGHCGFLQNSKLESWVDDRLLELFTTEARVCPRLGET